MCVLQRSPLAHCECASHASLGELTFEPGDREAIIAVNVLDDTVPEEEESFRVQRKNPRGGAELGIHSSVRVTVLSNDEAHGVVAFAQVRGPRSPHWCRGCCDD